MIEFKMPSLGADMEAGTLAEWLVKPGDRVKRGDIVAMVDTQKGLIDIEVFEDGKIKKLVLKEGEKVPVGTLMALIDDGNGVEKKQTGIKAEKPAQELVSKRTDIPQEKPVLHTHPSGRKVSPLARRIAKEKGVDLSKISSGTGEGGAITKEDVERAIMEKPAPPAAPKQASSVNIRQAVATAMSKSNREIPHYYLETKVDMSKALAWLAAANLQRPLNKRLLPAVLYIKAVARALADVPELNGYWISGFQAKTEINIGFVVALRGGGVMIPAIRAADKKSLDELMEALNDIIPRARALKLKSSELSESSFSLTSLGEEGPEIVFGMIYPPQVGLAGFGKINEEPWAEEGLLGVRPVVHISLSADHRATDGASGGRFLKAVTKYLGEPEIL